MARRARPAPTAVATIASKASSSDTPAPCSAATSSSVIRYACRATLSASPAAAPSSPGSGSGTAPVAAAPRLRAARRRVRSERPALPSTACSRARARLADRPSAGSGSSERPVTRSRYPDVAFPPMSGEDTAQVREEVVRSPAGVDLAVRQTGDPDAQAVIVMHGLFGTRDYVLMGSTLIEEAGFRVIMYDARGHGGSTGPDDPEAYGYDILAEDLVAVMDAFDVDAGLLLGVSMGAHTSLRLALDQPERVAGLVVVTPAYDPE